MPDIATGRCVLAGMIVAKTLDKCVGTCGLHMASTFVQGIHGALSWGLIMCQHIPGFAIHVLYIALVFIVCLRHSKPIHVFSVRLYVCFNILFIVCSEHCLSIIYSCCIDLIILPEAC